MGAGSPKGPPLRRTPRNLDRYSLSLTRPIVKRKRKADIKGLSREAFGPRHTVGSTRPIKIQRRTRGFESRSSEWEQANQAQVRWGKTSREKE